jgi:hypothetical protein
VKPSNEGSVAFSFGRRRWFSQEGRREVATAPLSSDVAIRDARGPDPEYFIFGVLPAEIRIDHVAFDPMDFLRTTVDLELSPEGLIAVSLSDLP